MLKRSGISGSIVSSHSWNFGDETGGLVDIPQERAFALRE